MIYNAITLLLTNKCNMKCPHCCIECSPENDSVLNDELLEKVILDLKENTKINMISISGGEAFLYLDKVKRAICLIKQVGKSSAVYTNGFWCTEYAETYDTMLELKNCGLTMLLTSIDSYHQQSISIENIKNLLNVCNELDIPVKLHVSTTFSNSSHNDELISKLGLSKLSASITQSAVFPVGRAAKNIPKEDIISSQKISHLKCRYDGMSSIDWNGNVFWCCSIHNENMIIGNISQRNINSILSDFRKNKPFMCLLTKGLPYLANTAEKAGLITLNERYADSCELCNSIFEDNVILDKLEYIL